MEIESTTEFDEWATISSMYDSFPGEAPTNASTSHNIQLRLYDVLIPIIGIVIIVFNGAVVFSSGLILKKGQQPRSTYLFLGNVAMADLVMGCAVLLGQFYPREYRDHGSCAIQIGMIVSSTIASVYSVALIAVDRFLYIVHGLQYQRWVYPTRARAVILLTWILGCIIGFLPAMGWSGSTENGRICWFILLAPPELILLTTILGVLPIIIVIILYSIILYHAIKKIIQLRRATTESTRRLSYNHQQTSGLRIFRGGTVATTNEDQFSDTEVTVEEPQQQNNIFSKLCRRKTKTTKTRNMNAPGPKSPSKFKAIKVVVLTTGLFFCTWVPYFIACTMYVFCNPDENPDYCRNLEVAIAGPLAILGFFNSLLNPVIYAWWHNGFRESFRKMFYRGRCCGKKSEIDGNRSNIEHSSSTRTTTTTTTTNNATIQGQELALTPIGASSA